MDYDYLEPTTDQPSHELMEDMLFEGQEMIATDGCIIWFGQRCPHGHVGWDVYLRFDPANYGIYVVDV